MESTTNSGDDSALLLLKEQEEKLKAKYGGMIPKKNLIVSDRKHFDSADWSRSKQQQQQQFSSSEQQQKQRKFGDADSSHLFFEEEVGVLKPVLGAKDVPGTSPPSDASTFTTTNTQTKRRTSMDESRGKWDIHNNANNNTSANNNNKNNNNSTAVNSAYHAPAPPRA
jgi:hypothetical protein